MVKDTPIIAALLRICYFFVILLCRTLIDQPGSLQRISSEIRKEWLTKLEAANDVRWSEDRRVLVW